MASREDLEELVKCPVCLDLFSDPRSLPCHHTLCLGCLEGVLGVNRQMECPVCRQAIQVTNGVSDFRADHKANSMLQMMTKASQGTGSVSREQTGQEQTGNIPGTPRRNSTGDDGNPSDTCSGDSTGHLDDLRSRFIAMNLGYQSGGPRCDECHNTFGPGVGMLLVNGRTLHEHCSCCSDCRMPIDNPIDNYQMKGGDVFCRICYDNKFSEYCKSCKGVIRDCGISFNNNPYHQDCFRCNKCRASLHHGNIQPKKNVPYCKNCCGQPCAKKCYICTKPIMSNYYIGDNGRPMHEKCYRCCRCNASLAHRGHIKEWGQYICIGCARRQQVHIRGGPKKQQSPKKR